MCGIAAIFAYDSSAPGVNEGELVSIRDCMALRGPDGAGLWFDPARRVGLGHRRLAIIDVSPAGAQPMLLPEKNLAITFNGEIYNYRELRAGLEKKGHHFRSTSDTEILLHLYAEEGEAMLDKLRGMFAFAIWDGVKQTLFLARDPFGIKPLYWADDGKTFRAASQVKALLAGGNIDISPEPAGHVGYFLWGHVPAPYTLYRGIRNLTAGHCMTIDARGKKHLRAFCSIPGILAEAEGRGGKSEIRNRKSEIQTSSSDFSAFQPLLRAALADSVRHHLIADVPVGVFLSSGLDSATIAALASEFGGQLRTVTLGIEEYKGTPNDETPLAEEVARRYGTNHQTIWVTRKDFENDLHRLFHAMDQPSCDGVNSYFISKAAAQAGLNVALSGLGGDELFGGYPSFREIPRAVSAFSPFEQSRWLGRAARVVTTPFLKHMTSPKYAGLLEYGGTYGGAYLLRRGMFMPWELPEILDGDLVREGWNELQTIAQLDDTAKGIHSPHLKVSALEMTWYMRHQLLRDTDWASMEHSLEVRVPLVDVELLRAIAPLFARELRPTKRDMALTSRSSLPVSVLDRPKTGFQVPVRQWLMEANQKAEGSRQKSGERGLRGWARLVHARFISGTSCAALRVSSRASQPSSLRHPVSDHRPTPSESDPRHILVFRIGQLGDTIVSLPAMQAIRNRYPDARLTLLCDRHPGKSFVLASDLLGRSGLFDEFLSYPVHEDQNLSRPWSMAPVLAALRRRKFDAVVYLAPSLRSPAQINRDRKFFRLAGIRNFIGMTNFAALPEKISGKPLPQLPSEADLLLDRLRADGIPVSAPGQARADLRLGLSEETEVAGWLGRLPFDNNRLWIGVGPGSKMPAKRWPEERFHEVMAELIKEFDVWPVVFGGNEDAGLGDRLISAWGCGYNAAGALSLRGSAAALRHCALLLTNDTGTMHLAAVVGTRCVAVFSAREWPGMWFPYGAGHRVFRSDIECEGCQLVECIERKNECLNRITLEQVLAGCKDVLTQKMLKTETLKFELLKC
jgi:asparagine synthase (glutamine-hydrolysing)